MRLMYVAGVVLILSSCKQNNTANEQLSTQEPIDSNAKTDLPAPYATESTVKTSKVIGWPVDKQPEAPAGFTVTRFASELDHPRWIYQLPNGDILVAETKKNEGVGEKVVSVLSGRAKSHGESEKQNRILIYRDDNKDGSYETKKVFLDDLNMPFGMVVAGNFFFVACSDAVWRYGYDGKQSTIVTKGIKIMELPNGGRHWTRNIVTNATGTKLYIAVGSGSDHAEDGIEKEERRARIFEINTDGTDERVYASGLRNPVGMDWYPGTNILWTAVNERDELGDNLPPDYITSVKSNGFYGWPYSYYGKNKDPRIEEKDQRNDLVEKSIVPDVPVGAHTSSLGLAFYDKKKFPAKYRNGAFVGQHGSWNRSVLSGYKVVFVPFNNGKPGKPEDFLTGFIANEEDAEVYGRPVGVTVLQDGSMLVADDAANIIWHVKYKK